LSPFHQIKIGIAVKPSKTPARIESEPWKVTLWNMNRVSSGAIEEVNDWLTRGQLKAICE
jgi:hypothetical protein